MHKIRRVAIMAALAISAFGASAGAASALTVTNPGTVTGTDSGNVQFNATFFGFPVSVTCSTANLTGSVAASGAVTISNATFSGCVDGFGGATTVTTNSLPWSASVTGSTGAYKMSNLGARVTVATPLGTCAYNGGSLTSTAKPSPVSSITYTAAGPLTTSTVGCGSGTLTGTYNLSRSITITG